MSEDQLPKMQILAGLKGKQPNREKAEALAHAQEEAPEFERVKWTSDPGLRALYWHCFVLLVSSASTGYDG